MGIRHLCLRFHGHVCCCRCCCRCCCFFLSSFLLRFCLSLHCVCVYLCLCFVCLPGVQHDFLFHLFVKAICSLSVIQRWLVISFNSCMNLKTHLVHPRKLFLYFLVF